MTLTSKIYSLGIKKDLPFQLIRKVKVLNTICFWILIINILTSFRWIILSVPQFIVLNFTAVAICLMVLLLNKRYYYNYALLLFLVYVPIHISFLGTYTELGFQQYLFPLMIIAGFLHDNRKKNLYYLIILSLIYLFLQADILGLEIIEFGITYSKTFFLLNALLSLVFCFMSIALFTMEYELNRSEILIKNRMLEESVKIAKEKAEYASLLFKEMNHRVKNNLQLVSSLLNIHAEKLTNKAAKDAMIDAKNRIHAIAILHKQLYNSENINKIDISVYLDDLVLYINDLIPDKIHNVDLQFHCDHLSLPVEDAVSVGLIISELLTNAVIHNDNKLPVKKIQLNIKHKDQKCLVIKIKENGSGISKESISSSKGFGFELIETLYRKYNGHLSVDDVNNILAVTLYFEESNIS